MEMERRRQYAMMKQHQNRRLHQQSKCWVYYDIIYSYCFALGEGGGKERSAETGQEGLEDVPDYQESLRKYALGLGDQETNCSSPSHSRERSERSRAAKPGKNHPEEGGTRKRKAPETGPHQYPGGPAPNGYPMPPGPYHSGHHLPPFDERRNEVFPPDNLYSSHASPYRMPGYPPYHMPRPGMKASGHDIPLAPSVLPTDDTPPKENVKDKEPTDNGTC